jgi:hypothetical protein
MTYAQALTSAAHSTPIASDIQQHTTSPTALPNNDLTDLKDMMKKLMEQMGTLLNLLTTFITRSA